MQASATSLVQTSAILAFPSSNTTFMFFASTTTGVCGMNGVPSAAVCRGGRLLAVEQLHGQVHAGLRLELERLVDGRELLAEQDVLQAGRARVLAADRNLRPFLSSTWITLAGVEVVRDPDRVDLALSRGVGLLEVASELLGASQAPGVSNAGLMPAAYMTLSAPSWNCLALPSVGSPPT